MTKPFFSCVVPVKGPRPFFDEALASLKAQGLGDDLEIIIQDADVESDSGQSDAFNKGFAKAKGEWLFWLNADDVLLPGALKRVKEVIDRRGTKVDWIAGNDCYVDMNGCVERCMREAGWKRFYHGLPVRTFGPSSFFRRELLEVCGPFDTSLHYCMDTDLWCKFRAAGYWYVKVPHYVWGFRIHGGSKTSGALVGEIPPRMREEIAIVDKRCGMNHWRMRLLMLRVIRLLDGSTLKSTVDTIRFRGKNWKEIV